MYLNPDAVSKLAKLAKCLWYHLSPCTCSCSLAQLCVILCDPTDSSPPGSSVYGMSQAKTQEKVAISSSRRSSWPRDWTHISWVFCLGRRILCHWATGNILLIPNCLKTSFFVDLFKLEPDKEKVAYLVVMIKSGYLCYWNNVLFCFTKRL